MKVIYPLIAATALLSACAPGAAIDSDMERGLVGAALGYGAAKAVKGNGDRGAIIAGLPVYSAMMQAFAVGRATELIQQTVKGAELRALT